MNGSTTSSAHSKRPSGSGSTAKVSRAVRARAARAARGHRSTRAKSTETPGRWASRRLSASGKIFAQESGRPRRGLRPVQPTASASISAFAVTIRAEIASACFSEETAGSGERRRPLPPVERSRSVCPTSRSRHRDLLAHRRLAAEAPGGALEGLLLGNRPQAARCLSSTPSHERTGTAATAADIRRVYTVPSITGSPLPEGACFLGAWLVVGSLATVEAGEASVGVTVADASPVIACLPRYRRR